jgi:hypothetical protein
MRRYFFDAYDGRQHCIDPQGEDLGSDQEACDQAIVILHALIRDDPHLGQTRSYHVSVRCDAALVVYQVECVVTENWTVREDAAGPTFPKAGRDRPEAVGS